MRYLSAKSSTNAINIISWITVGAMALGTLVMITMMSVFNGFESLVVDMFNVFYADLNMSPERGKYMTLTKEQLQELKSIDGIAMLSTILEEDALLEYQNEQYVATVKGVERNYLDIISLDERFIVNGTLDLNRGEVPLALLGMGVRNGLGVNVNNPFAQIKVSIPRKNAGASSFENAFNFNHIIPGGEFNIQQEFDEKYVLVPQGFVQDIRGSNSEFSSVEIKLLEDADEDAVVAAIRTLIPGIIVKNRYEQNATLYNVMRTEKWVFFAILTLILIIVSFSITGTLSMLIVDKKKDIAVLRSLGATTGIINKIFLTEGVLLAFVGAAIGIILTIIICTLQQMVGVVPMPGNTFVVDYYPVKMQFLDFVAASFIIFLISILASYLPTLRAAKNIALSETMRME